MLNSSPALSGSSLILLPAEDSSVAVSTLVRILRDGKLT